MLSRRVGFKTRRYVFVGRCALPSVSFAENASTKNIAPCRMESLSGGSEFVQLSFIMALHIFLRVRHEGPVTDGPRGGTTLILPRVFKRGTPSSPTVGRTPAEHLSACVMGEVGTSPSSKVGTDFCLRVTRVRRNR